MNQVYDYNSGGDLVDCWIDRQHFFSVGREALAALGVTTEQQLHSIWSMTTTATDQPLYFTSFLCLFLLLHRERSMQSQAAHDWTSMLHIVQQQFHANTLAEQLPFTAVVASTALPLPHCTWRLADPSLGTANMLSDAVIEVVQCMLPCQGIAVAIVNPSSPDLTADGGAALPTAQEAGTLWYQLLKLRPALHTGAAFITGSGNRITLPATVDVLPTACSCMIACHGCTDFNCYCFYVCLDVVEC